MPGLRSRNCYKAAGRWRTERVWGSLAWLGKLLKEVVPPPANRGTRETARGPAGHVGAFARYPAVASCAPRTGSLSLSFSLSSESLVTQSLHPGCTCRVVCTHCTRHTPPRIVMEEPPWKKIKLSLERPHKDDDGNPIPVLLDITADGQHIYEPCVHLGRVHTAR